MLIFVRFKLQTYLELSFLIILAQVTLRSFLQVSVVSLKSLLGLSQVFLSGLSQVYLNSSFNIKYAKIFQSFPFSQHWSLRGLVVQVQYNSLCEHVHYVSTVQVPPPISRYPALNTKLLVTNYAPATHHTTSSLSLSPARSLKLTTRGESRDHSDVM